MDAVINASPLILLNKIGRLYLLNELFDSIFIPNSVLREIDPVNASELKVGLSGLSFIPLEVSNVIAVRGLLGRLHIGEVEVMVGAIEKSVSTVILDDNAARNKAKQLGLEVTGTVGILLRARRLGLISDIGPELNKLISVGMYLSDELIMKILNF